MDLAARGAGYLTLALLALPLIAVGLLMFGRRRRGGGLLLVLLVAIVGIQVADQYGAGEFLTKLIFVWAGAGRQ